MNKYKKYTYPFLTLIAIAIIGFQAYFDIQIRKTNALMVSHIVLLEKFVQEKFPQQVSEFDASQQALSENNQTK